MARETSGIFRRLRLNIPFGEKIKNLGMAQKQMVEIAKALTFHARILILDEPTASLTQQEVDALFGIIRELKAEGVSIVYISHRLEEIFQLCDRVTVIRDGRYIATRLVADTCKDELVCDMVGRSMSSYYPKAEVEIGETLLSAKGLGDRNLLHDIDFFVRKGEILGFAGIAGSGRTELAQALCGFTQLTGGTVELEGRRVRFSSYHEAMEHGLVYVSEDRGKYGVILDMSIKDNIAMPQLEKNATLGVMHADREYALAERMRERVDIKAPDTDFLVANLSGGTSRRFRSARRWRWGRSCSSWTNPPAAWTWAPRRRSTRSSAAGGLRLTILLISSELPELIGMCDRICIMRDGTVAGSLDRSEFSQERILNVALAPVDVPCKPEVSA